MTASDNGEGVMPYAPQRPKPHPCGCRHCSHGAPLEQDVTASKAAPAVIVRGFVSPFLKGMGEHDTVDELRIIICDDERTTAYFTFSSQMRPSMHEFRIFGLKNGLVLDQDHEILIKLRGNKFKSYGNEVAVHAGRTVTGSHPEWRTGGTQGGGPH